MRDTLLVEFLNCKSAADRCELICAHPELLGSNAEKLLHSIVFKSGRASADARQQAWNDVAIILNNCRRNGPEAELFRQCLDQAWSKGTDALRVAIKNARESHGSQGIAENLPDPELVRCWSELAMHPDFKQFPKPRAYLLRQNAMAYTALFDGTGDPQFAYHACESIEALGGECTKREEYERCLYFVMAANKEHLDTAKIEPLDNAIKECQKQLPKYEKGSPEFRFLHTCLGNLFLNKARQTGMCSDAEEAIAHYANSAGKDADMDQVLCLGNLGLARLELFKHSQQAEVLELGIENLREASSKAAKRSLEQCEVQNNLALALKEKFRKTKEVPLIKEAIGYLEECARPDNPGFDIDGAVRLDNLGTTLREYSEYLYFAGNNQECLKVLDHCIEIHKQANKMVESGKGPRGYMYGFLNNLGLALKNKNAIAPNDSDLAAAAECLEQAISLISPQAAFRCALLNNLAMCKWSLYDRSGDEKMLNEAINAMQASTENVIAGYVEQIEYLHRLASYKAYRFNKRQQLSDLEEALKALEQAWLIAQETLNWSILTYKLGQQEQSESINELLIDLNLAKAQMCPQEKQVALKRALEIAESSKSRLLLSMLNYQDFPAPDDLPKELIEEEHRCLQALFNFDRDQLSSYGIAEDSKSEKSAQFSERKTLIDSLKSIWKQMESSKANVADYLAMRRGYGVNWNNIADSAKKLGEENALIALFSNRQEIVIFIVKAGESETHVLRVPLNAIKLEEFVKDFQAKVFVESALESTAQPRVHKWRELGLALFAPIMQHLQGIKHITISAYGALHTLPLHALFVNQTGNCLLDHFSVSYIPALGPLSTLLGKVSAESSDALVLGYTRASRERPLFIGEAESVKNITKGELAIDDKASVATLEKYSKKPLKILHFSCHGAFDSADPLNSRILLADGTFTVRSWLALQLEVNLVTLSACQLAQTGSLGGQEMTGFVQAIFISGGRSALLGLWSVDAEATKLLMEKFYQYWLDETTPRTKAEALRQAVLSLRKVDSSENSSLSGIDFSDPYFWAAFCLYGV